MMTNFEWLRTCALAVAGSPLDLLGLLLLAVAATAWIGLAARAAWIVEQRGYAPGPYLFLGLLMPFAYPLWVIQNPPASKILPPPPVVPAEAGRKKLTVPSAMAPAPAVSAAPGVVPAPAGGGGIIPTAAPLTAEYFLDLIGRGAVTPATPCQVECGEGTSYTVTGLIQVQAELIVANVRSPATGAEQRMRLPYARMQRVGPG